MFSLVPEVREAWLRVVRARLAEMGERGDVAALTEAVTHAGALASELVSVEAPSLAATAFGELERAVLPTRARGRRVPGAAARAGRDRRAADSPRNDRLRCPRWRSTIHRRRGDPDACCVCPRRPNRDHDGGPERRARR